MKAITVPSIKNRKNKTDAEKITALTAYDYTMAKLIDEAGVDIILIGDSLASVVQGYKTTIPVTLDEICYHCKCVSKGAKHALVVGDLPFMSYQVSPEQAIESSGKLIKDGGVSAVKLEGGIPMAKTIERITAVDIPVMAHVGLTPQSYHRMGGHKVQGKKKGTEGKLEAGTRLRIIEDAKATEDSGAFAVVLECIPSDLATEITEILKIPTIGIGSGANCDGQILVVNDMLGFNLDFTPKLAKKYRELGKEIVNATSEYIEEIKQGNFPTEEHEYKAKPKSSKKLKAVS